MPAFYNNELNSFFTFLTYLGLPLKVSSQGYLHTSRLEVNLLNGTFSP